MGLGIGVLVGASAAAVVDMAVLAWGERKPRPATTGASSLLPSVDVQRGRAVLGVMGSF
ncbi:hypothetical protein A7982_12514 [Minicystis rosea]|nr:hypothetical protein A7982_12514 [Minicystis rosea]